MDKREEIVVTDMPKIIRMPLIKGDYFTHDIGMFVSCGNEVHIYRESYREVKCGKGVRKLNNESSSLNIPFEILDIFINSLQKIKNDNTTKKT